MTLSAGKPGDILVRMVPHEPQIVSLFCRMQLESRRVIKISMAPTSRNAASRRDPPRHNAATKILGTVLSGMFGDSGPRAMMVQ